MIYEIIVNRREKRKSIRVSIYIKCVINRARWILNTIVIDRDEVKTQEVDTQYLYTFVTVMTEKCISIDDDFQYFFPDIKAYILLTFLPSKHTSKIGEYITTCMSKTYTYVCHEWKIFNRTTFSNIILGKRYFLTFILIQKILIEVYKKSDILKKE